MASQISVSVPVAKDYVPAAIAPLGDVMGRAGENSSGEAGHAGRLTRAPAT